MTTQYIRYPSNSSSNGSVNTYSTFSAFPATAADGAAAIALDTDVLYIFNLASSTWRAVNLIINVKQYGAIGDGVNNDTVAIQAALDAVPSSGGNVYFPMGLYLISAALVPKANTYIYGVGPGSTIKTGTTKVGNNTGMIQAHRISNLVLQNLKFDGGGSWTSTPFANPYGGGNSVGFTNNDHGFRFYQSSDPAAYTNIQILDCEFTGLGSAVSFEGQDTISQIMVSRNYVHNCGTSGIRVFNIYNFLIVDNKIEGIYGNLTAAGDTTVADSEFADCILMESSSDGIVANNNCYDFIRCGIIVEPNTATLNTRLNIANNIIRHGHDARNGELLSGIYIGDSGDASPIQLTGNIISDLHTVTGSASGMYIQNAIVTGGAIYDIKNNGVNPGPAVTLDGVEISGCGGHGIAVFELAAGDRFTARNCNIFSNTLSGIYLDQCHGNIEMDGNTFTDNGGNVISTQYNTAITVNRYYNDQKVIIRNNTFISSANQGATQGQLYSIYGVDGGDFTRTDKYITCNTFLFTGTFSSTYPATIGLAPCSFAFDNTSVVTPYEIENVYGNLNSKSRYTGQAFQTTGTPLNLCGYATSAPVTGGYKAGDYFLNDTVASGGPAMFVCVVAGTPGTWESWGGVKTTLATVGSSPNTSGASLSNAGVLTLQPADGTRPGLLTAGTQSIGGDKTFTGAISASNLSGTNTGNQTITLTSDVTGSGTGSFATTIAANAVTNAKAAQMATNTIKGNNTGGTANAADLTVSQVNTLLGTVTTLAAVGAVPNSNGASIASNTLTLQPADGTRPGLLTAGTQSIGGDKTFTSAPKLKGVTDASSATAGDVGELLTASTGTTNVATSAVFFDATSISLTAGDWDVEGTVIYIRNGATYTSTDFFAGITATSGNTTSGCNANANEYNAIIPTTYNNFGLESGTTRVSISSTTTYYLKAVSGTFTSGTPQYQGYLRARRMR